MNTSDFISQCNFIMHALENLKNNIGFFSAVTLTSRMEMLDAAIGELEQEAIGNVYYRLRLTTAAKLWLDTQDAINHFGKV